MSKKRFMLSVFFIIMIFSLSDLNVSMADLIGYKIRKEIKKGLLNNEVTLIPQLNNLTAGFGSYENMDYYFTKTISKIFFQDKIIDVEIRKIKFHSAMIELELFHDILGLGKINFYFKEDDIKSASSEKIRSIILSTLDNEHQMRVFCDENSKACHLYSCNHLPDQHRLISLNIDEAKKNSFKMCGFCFEKKVHLPELAIEKTLAKKIAAEVRYYNPELVDPEKQAYLIEVGKKVINNWPYKQLGYKYSFKLIESPEFNACALPGGKVFITSSLFNSLENDEELEAIIAHEIAHVESRHALKSYKMRCTAAETQAALAIFIGVAAGAYASSDNYNAAAAASAVGLIGLSAIDIYYKGYNKEYEKEADLLAMLYFDENRKNRSNLKNIFKKFQFLNLNTHGDIEVKNINHPYLYERIDRVDNTKFLYFGKNKSYLVNRKKGCPVQMNLIYQSIYQNENRLAVYFNDFSFVNPHKPGEIKRIELKIGDQMGKVKFKMNENYLTRDTWGAYMVFDNKTKKRKDSFLKDIDKIIIKVTDEIVGGGTEPERVIKNYELIEGEIEI